jgi:hypothetical protein
VRQQQLRNQFFWFAIPEINCKDPADWRNAKQPFAWVTYMSRSSARSVLLIRQIQEQENQFRCCGNAFIH